MIDIYMKYKYDFFDYILFIKNGNFYICINKDAIILSSIFDYKIVESKNFVKVGFPFNSLEKNLKKLNELTINYIVIDNQIILKEKFVNNKYNEYVKNDNYKKNIDRINKICNVLKANIKYHNIDTILKSIEDIICMINY